MENLANWMKQLADPLYVGHFNERPLGEICLPGTHDSATANLTTELTEAMDAKAKGTIEGLSEWGGLFSPIALSTTRDFAVATKKCIAEQLRDGIRAFDFRVYHHPKGFFSVHSLLGENYETIFEQLRAFLCEDKGEIVYAWFRINPWITDPKQADWKIWRQFTDLIETTLGEFLIRHDEVTKPGGPFSETYGALTHDGTRSRILIEFESGGLQGIDFCFTRRELNLVSTASCDVAGEYGVPSGLLSREDVIRLQHAICYKDVINRSSPFMVWLTRPSTDVEPVLVIRDRGFHELEERAIRSGSGTFGVAMVKTAISKYLGKQNPRFATDTVVYNTLKEIADPLNEDIAGSIDQIIPSLPLCIRLSAIFVDFYENTDMVKYAIMWNHLWRNGKGCAGKIPEA